MASRRKFKVGDQVYRLRNSGHMRHDKPRSAAIVGVIVRLVPRQKGSRHPFRVKVRWLPKGNESCVEERALILTSDAEAQNLEVL